MHIGRYIFLFFFSFLINTAEISVRLDKKKTILSEKSNPNIADWNTSFSRKVITLPKELGVKIMIEVFECNDQKLKNMVQERSISSTLKYFYQKQLYKHSIQQSKLNRSSFFEWPQFENLNDSECEKLFSILDRIQKDRTSLCCLNDGRKSGLVISENNYGIMLKFASDSDLVLDNRQLWCCYDWNEPRNTICSLWFASANCLLPCSIVAGNIIVGLTCWGACYFYNNGFRQLYGFHKKNS